MKDISYGVWLLSLVYSSVVRGTNDYFGDDKSELDEAVLPPPTNISVDSFNFNTTVQWDWKSSKISGTPLFTVFIKSIRHSFWEKFPFCIRIREHHCDVSEFVDDLDDCYFFGIKAEVDSMTSKLAEYSEFYLQNYGKIGPPKLNVKINGPNVSIVIYHPLSAIFDDMQQLSVNDLIGDYSYSLFFGENGSLPEEFIVENCGNQSCSITKTVPKIGANYCASAEGKSDRYGIKGMKSEELCFYVAPFKDEPKTDRRVETIVIAIIAIGTGIVCLVTAIGITKLLQEKHIWLPKSLVSVMRNVSIYQVNGSRPDGFLSAVTMGQSSDKFDESSPFYGGESPDPENEDSEVKKTVAPVETSIITEIVGTTEEYNINSGHFSVESGRYSSESGPYSSEISVVETSENNNSWQSVNDPCIPVRTSDYDRAHVPIQLLIETSTTDTVIGYKLTQTNTNQSASAES